MMKQTKRVLVLAGTLLLMCMTMQAGQPDKSDKIAPRWKSGSFPKNHDSSYYFKVAQGDGMSLSEACENAVLALVGDLANMHGVSIKGSAIEKLKAESHNHVYTEAMERNYTYNLDFENFKTAFTQYDDAGNQYTFANNKAQLQLGIYNTNQIVNLKIPQGVSVNGSVKVLNVEDEGTAMNISLYSPKPEQSSSVKFNNVKIRR